MLSITSCTRSRFATVLHLSTPFPLLSARHDASPLLAHPRFSQASPEMISSKAAQKKARHRSAVVGRGHGRKLPTRGMSLSLGMEPAFWFTFFPALGARAPPIRINKGDCLRSFPLNGTKINIEAYRNLKPLQQGRLQLVQSELIQTTLCVCATHYFGHEDVQRPSGF